jgi:hypothetical protein
MWSCSMTSQSLFIYCGVYGDQTKHVRSWAGTPLVFMCGERSCGLGLGLPVMPLCGLFFGAVQAWLRCLSIPELLPCSFRRALARVLHSRMHLVASRTQAVSDNALPSIPGSRHDFPNYSQHHNIRIKINKNIGHVTSSVAGLGDER